MCNVELRDAAVLKILRYIYYVDWDLCLVVYLEKAMQYAEKKSYLLIIHRSLINISQRMDQKKKYCSIIMVYVAFKLKIMSI